jgi:hypothetical protein
MDVCGLFDHADHGAVAARVGADPAQFAVGDGAAHGAKTHAVTYLLQHGLQPVDFRRLHLQQVEGDALRALGTDAWQFAQLVDQILDRALVHLR